MTDGSTRKAFRLKEPFSGISHFIGAVLGLVLLVALLILADGRVRDTVAYAVYGGSLIALYTASAVYHSLHVHDRIRGWLQKMDHAAIFMLIAGTYTPVCLVALWGRGGAWILAVEWGLALFGIAGILLWKNAPHWLRVTLYIAMGWLAVAAWPQMRAALPPAALSWIIAGGLAYTGGVFFFALDQKKLLGRIPLTAHDVWHVFVMAGSACHAIAIVRFIALPA